MLLNTDHVYKKGVAEKVRRQCERLCAFCDSDRRLGADDMKVELDEGGSLKRISKSLDRFQLGYVGMTFCPRESLQDYFFAFDRVAEKHGDKAVVEMVLGELAGSGKRVFAGDISGVGWLEIDTPEEHALAEKAIAERPDDFPRLEAWRHG